MLKVLEEDGEKQRAAVREKAQKDMDDILKAAREEGEKIKKEQIDLVLAPLDKEKSRILNAAKLEVKKKLAEIWRSTDALFFVNLFTGCALLVRVLSDWASCPSLLGAAGETRTPTPLPGHGPKPCAYANSATAARESDGFEKDLRRFYLRNLQLPYNLQFQPGARLQPSFLTRLWLEVKFT